MSIDGREIRRLETPIILAQQFMDLIRNAGVTKSDAHAALNITATLLTAATDIRFRADVYDPDFDGALDLASSAD